MSQLFTKPYQLRTLIASLGQQGQPAPNVTLGDALDAVQAVVDELPGGPCPKCGTTGLINSNTQECDYCYGWGKTTNPGTVQTQYTPVQPIPSLDITPSN